MKALRDALNGSYDRRAATLLTATVLLSMQLRHPNSIEAVQMFAQHKSDSTTRGYVAKLPHRMILEQRMRQFSDTIEVVISDQDTRKKMGRGVARWQEAIRSARRTGLGVWCADPQAGAQPDFPTGTTCHAVDRCLTCPKVLVVADEDSVVQRDAVRLERAPGAVDGGTRPVGRNEQSSDQRGFIKAGRLAQAVRCFEGAHPRRARIGQGRRAPALRGCC